MTTFDFFAAIMLALGAAIGAGILTVLAYVLAALVVAAFIAAMIAQFAFAILLVRRIRRHRSKPNDPRDPYAEPFGDVPRSEFPNLFAGYREGWK